MEENRVATTAERMKEAMQRANMKQADLARATEINTGAICRYLSGAYEPKQTAINKIAVALGVSEMWLWGYNVPMERTAEQKKNDDMVKIIAQMRKDPKFFDIVSKLAERPAELYDSLNTILSALDKK